MFTGIIESMAELVAIKKEENNVHFQLRCAFTEELKVDQSIAHNGTCLTVVEIDGDCYTVTAIAETLNRTNLNDWKIGDKVNLERCLRVSDRLDGHWVQGHVDQIGQLKSIEEQGGSYLLRVSYENPEFLTVAKGSICVNGVSLTVVDSLADEFSIAIIPYTWEHTNLHQLQVGDSVNLEFDILGKYIQKLGQKIVL